MLAILAVVLMGSMVLSTDERAVSILGYQLPMTCMFRAITGVRCPACGLTRGFVFMGHGQLVDAFRIHPLAPFLFALLVQQVIWRTVGCLRRITKLRKAASLFYER